MRICSACGEAFDRSAWLCPHCEHVVPLRGGFPALAPTPTSSGEGFRPEEYGTLAASEATSFWFRARNRLIVWSLNRYLPDLRSFLEIGCGTGFVLAGIRQAFPNAALCGSEIFSEGLPFAAARLPGVELLQMDARRIPFVDHFDAVGAFDVLEHIEQDQEVLTQLHRALVPGGGLIVTVPQHRFLWSRQDDFACHVRRYSSRELRAKVEAAGFRIVKMTSFVSLLLPLMLASRLPKRKADAKFDVCGELILPRSVNLVLEAVMMVERTLIQCGVSFPVGGSLLLVARKN